jgi:hypothetical protein
MLFLILEKSHLFLVYALFGVPESVDEKRYELLIFNSVPPVPTCRVTRVNRVGPDPCLGTFSLASKALSGSGYMPRG